MLSVPVEASGDSFRHGNPKTLFEGSYVPEGIDAWGAPSYAVARDGQRFLMMKERAQGEAGGGRQIVVIVNWPEELKRLLNPK